MDKLTKEQRRKNMQAVKATGSKIETALSQALFAKGYRYRKNDKSVFGKPDLIFKKQKIAVFVDSEFWHGKNWDVRKNDHKSNRDFWIPKIERNIERDREVNEELARLGWQVLRFWGDDIKKDLPGCIVQIEAALNDATPRQIERILSEEYNNEQFIIRIVEPEYNKDAILTHYLHNRNNETAAYYKKDAVRFAKEILQQQRPDDKITEKDAEKALQNGLFDTPAVPFLPIDAPRFKFIDLFAGIGGFRLALQHLGGQCVFSDEWDESAQKTYRVNFGETPFGDITKEETKAHIPDGFDILCAGFPCQAFSIAGRRSGFDDTRGTLFFDVAEIIRRKQPRAVFLENVKGLRNHARGKTLETILNVLRKDLGYYVPDPQIVNAKDFGVPQNRERIFIVGFRRDTGITEFSYPEPTGKKVAFADIKEDKPVAVKYYLSTQYLTTLEKHKTRHENKGNGFGYEIIRDDGIANAVVVGGMGRERNLVYDNRITNFTPTTNIKGEVNRRGIRRMTPREWARLQGYPDNFIIPVADASAYKQFGNSVAVPAIQATASKILEKLSIEMS